MGSFWDKLSFYLVTIGTLLLVAIGVGLAVLVVWFVFRMGRWLALQIPFLRSNQKAREASPPPQKPDGHRRFSRLGSAFRGFLSTAWDFVRVRYGKRGQFWAFAVQGHATIIVKQGIQDRVLLSGIGPRSIERQAMANQRNAQFLLELKKSEPDTKLKMPDEQRFRHWALEDYLTVERGANGTLVERSKTFPVPPKDDTVDESSRYNTEVEAFEEWLDTFHQENRDHEAELIRLNPGFKRQLPYVVVGVDRRRTAAVWMGMTWNHWVYGHKIPNYIGLFQDGLPTTISLQETPYRISKQTDVTKRQAGYSKEKGLTAMEKLIDSIYTPQTNSADGIPTDASQVIVPRVHDPGKAVFVLENGAIPLIRIRSLLNRINPFYLQAVATLRWDAVVKNIEESLKKDNLFDETLTEEDVKKVEARLVADIKTMITQHLNTIYQVKLGILREVKYWVDVRDDMGKVIGREARVRYVDWSVQTIAGVQINRYPESNPGIFAQIQRDWGIYNKDAMIQDIDPPDQVQNQINELVEELFARVKAIVTASGEGKSIELRGRGEGKAEEARRAGISAGLVRQKHDLGIKSGELVLQLDTARAALPGIGTKVLVPNSDPGGLFSGLMGAAMVGKAAIEPGQPNPPVEPVVPETPEKPKADETSPKDSMDKGQSPSEPDSGQPGSN